MFERTGAGSCCSPPVARESQQTLLISTDGLEWTPHSILDSATDKGLQIESGEFFWVYGPHGYGGNNIERYFEFDTIWISSDATSWRPVDISFTAEHSIVTVSGDEIIVSSASGSGTTWVGCVEATIVTQGIGNDGAPQPQPDSDGLPTRQWLRVPHDDVVGGGADITLPGLMTDVTRGGPGLVAVGSDYGSVCRLDNALEGCEDFAMTARPAVWTSVDGLIWNRIPSDGPDIGRGAMKKVTAGGPGLVAVGWGAGNGLSGAVWTSVDGIAWSQVPFDEPVFGNSIIDSVTAGGPGLVAVGTVYDPPQLNQTRHAAVWTSADGRTWSRVTHDDDEVFATASMRDVTAGDTGLVAVGYDDDAGIDGGAAAVWLSADGLTWTRVPHDPTVFGDNSNTAHSYQMTGVSVGGPGLVAVGWFHGPAATPTPAVWTSANGTTWFRVPHNDTAFAENAYFDTVTVGEAGLVAVGIAGCGPAVWTSNDGLEWSRTTFVEDMSCSTSGASDPITFGVTAGGPGFVVVGHDDNVAAVWVTPPDAPNRG